MNRRLLSLFALISLLGYLTSCDGLLDDLKVEAQFSAPIGSASLTSADIIDNIGNIGSQLTPDEEGVLTYSISDSCSIINASTFSSLISIPVQSSSLLFPLPDLSSLLDPTGFVLSGVSQTIAVDVTSTVLLSMPDNETLDSVVCSNSTISVTIDEDLISSLGFENLKVTINQIKDSNGDVVVLEPNKTLTLDENFTMVPINNSTVTNGLELQLTGDINLEQYTAASELSSSFNFVINNIVSVTGDLGTNSIEGTSVEFTADNTLTEFLSDLNDIYFANPQIILEFDYGYQADAIITIDNFSISGTQIEFKDGCDKFYIAPNSTTAITLSNASTANGEQLSQLINSNFSSFSLTVSSVVNPTDAEVAAISGAPSSYTQAQSYTLQSVDEINLEYKVSLPFDLNVQGLNFSEEMSLDLSDTDTDDIDIEELAMGFSTENGLPFDIVLQAKLGDNYIFDSAITIPASVNVNTSAITPSVNSGADMIIAQIKQEYANELINSSNSLVFELSLSSKDNSSVKLYESSYLNLNLLIGTQLTFALNN